MWLVNETEWRSPPVAYPSAQQDLGKRACRLKAYVRQKGRERPITIFEIMQLLEGSIVSLSDIGFFFFFVFLSLFFVCLSLFWQPSDFSPIQSQHAWLRPYLPPSFHLSLSFLWLLLLPVLSPPWRGGTGSGGVEKCKCW